MTKKKVDVPNKVIPLIILNLKLWWLNRILRLQIVILKLKRYQKTGEWPNG